MDRQTDAKAGAAKMAAPRLKNYNNENGWVFAMSSASPPCSADALSIFDKCVRLALAIGVCRAEVPAIDAARISAGAAPMPALAIVRETAADMTPACA